MKKKTLQDYAKERDPREMTKIGPAVKVVPIEQEPQRNTIIKTAPTIDELVGLAVQGNYDLDKLEDS